MSSNRSSSQYPNHPHDNRNITNLCKPNTKSHVRGSFLTRNLCSDHSLSEIFSCSVYEIFPINFAYEPTLTFLMKACLPSKHRYDTRRATLIFWMVQEMRLLTVSTDSTVSLAVGRLFTKIWNATVRRHPPA